MTVWAHKAGSAGALRTAVVGLVPLLLAGGVCVFEGAPAQASAPPTVTVSPSTGLTDGTVVHVTYTGLAAGETVSTLQCAIPDPDVSDPWALFDDCQLDHQTSATADEPDDQLPVITGAISTDGARCDPGATCWIVSYDPSPNGFEEATQISFKPINPGDDLCPSGNDTSWQNAYVAQSIEVPSVAPPPDGIIPAGFSDHQPPSYDGLILRPQDATPGQLLPTVVLMHGRGGDRCSLWYLARDFAGHGYVALTLQNPAGAGDPLGDSGIAFAIDAALSGYEYVETPTENVYAQYTNTTDIGLVGHSIGAIAVNYLQGGNPQADPGPVNPLPNVKAIVALDNLYKKLPGDPGGASDICGAAPAVDTNPVVPGLGMAFDGYCPSNPTKPAKVYHSKGLKINYGWNQWANVAGLPALETVMHGFIHGNFTDDPRWNNNNKVNTPDERWQSVSWYSLAWLDQWLYGGRNDAEGRLFACAVGSDQQSTQAVLSDPSNPTPPPPAADHGFYSAASLPASGPFPQIYTTDLRTSLATGCVSSP